MLKKWEDIDTGHNPPKRVPMWMYDRLFSMAEELAEAKRRILAIEKLNINLDGKDFIHLQSRVKKETKLFSLTDNEAKHILTIHGGDHIVIARHTSPKTVTS